MSDSVRQQLAGWGGAVHSTSDVVRVASEADVIAAFKDAAREGRRVGLRGSGCSYGDASLNHGGLVLDLTGMNRVLAFDTTSGVVRAEAGLTIRDLWRHGIRHGFWPPVVSGTAAPTLGGVLGANIHGKNAFHAGTFANHVDSFRLVVASGEVLTVSRDSHAELFHAVPGSFGLLGCVTEITLRMRPVPGGRLQVSVLAPRSLGEMIHEFESRKATSDYLVGWIDGFARGRELGRGVIHQANYVGIGTDPEAQRSLTVDAQDLSDTFLGVIPKSVMWILLRPWLNDFGMRVVNGTKDFLARREARNSKSYFQSHAAFAFLLDYVPGWKRAYGHGGLIQYQSFIPAASAERIHSEMLRRAQLHDLIPYLLVYKRHLPEPFLMTHAVDGFSMAMDFRVTPSRRQALWNLCKSFDTLVAEAGGRIYFAKDATATAESVAAIFGPELVRFMALRRELDPQGLLTSDLAVRLGLA